MTVTENERGQQNMWATEPRMYIDPIAEQQMKNEVYETHNDKAERLNGRLAMLGFVAAVVSYVFTGKLVFGVY